MPPFAIQVHDRATGERVAYKKVNDASAVLEALESTPSVKEELNTPKPAEAVPTSTPAPPAGETPAGDTTGDTPAENPEAGA